jgi:hypothetical protein
LQRRIYVGLLQRRIYVGLLQIRAKYVFAFIEDVTRARSNDAEKEAWLSSRCHDLKHKPKTADAIIIELKDYLGRKKLRTTADLVRRTHLTKMILPEIAQDVSVDRVLTECSFILFEAKVPKPTSEVTNLSELGYHLIRARS